MKNEIDSQRALLVFNKIIQQGEKVSATDVADGNYALIEHTLCGLTAQADHDGYTLVVCDAQVTLTLLFHNKYQFDYPNSEALSQFMHRFSEVEKYIPT